MFKKIVLMFLINCIIAISMTTAYAMPPAYVESVEISDKCDLEIEIGESISLTATAVPVGLNYVYMKWSTDNPEIISINTVSPEEKLDPPVSTAEITALAEGTVTITVYADYDLSYPLISDSVTIKIIEASKIEQTVIPTDGGFKASASSSHTIFLSSNGIVSARGENGSGACGKTDTPYVEKINYIDFSKVTDSKIVDVAAGSAFTVVCDDNGKAFGLGSNQQENLLIPRPSESSAKTRFDTPQKIPYIDKYNIIDVEATIGKVMFRTKDGFALYGSGEIADNIDFFSVYGSNIVVGRKNGCVNADFAYSPLDENSNIKALAAGKKHFAVIAENNNDLVIYVQGGSNDKYEFGEGNEDGYEDILIEALTIPNAANKQYKLTCGDYHTVVDVWDENSEYVEEYVWGTGCYYSSAEGLNENVVKTPQKRLVNHIILANAPEKGGVAYNYKDCAIEIFGEEEVKSIPILETDQKKPLSKEEFEALPYETVTVNFVTLDEEAFNSYQNEYEVWEYVDEHTFRYKSNELVYDENRAHSVITVPKEITNESVDFTCEGARIAEYDSIEVTESNKDKFELSIQQYDDEIAYSVSPLTEEYPELYLYTAEYDSEGRLTSARKIPFVEGWASIKYNENAQIMIWDENNMPVCKTSKMFL